MIWNEYHDYALLGIDSILVGILYTLYKKKDKIIQNLINAPSVSIGPALEDLVNEQGGSLPYIAVRGRVSSIGQPIESQHGLKGVLQLITLNEHSVRRHGFGHWGDSIRTIQQSQNSTPFGLKNLNETTTNNLLVEIENPFEAMIENLLIPVSTNFTPTNSSMVSTIIGFVTGVASKGVETTEDFLPLETCTTAVGELIKVSDGKYKLMQPKYDDQPYILSTYPVQSIVKKMQGRNNTLKVVTFIFFTVGVIVAARRIKIWFKKYRLGKMRETILKRRNQVDLQGLSEAQTCIVCLMNPREVILLKCGHVVVCCDCVTKLESKCPICRETFIDTHAAYIS